jgi:cytochrome d ubiquinol oxidase subunit II
MLTTIATLIHVPSVTRNFVAVPIAWIVVGLNVLAIANIPRAVYKDQPGYAFISSGCTIAALTFLFGTALFPNLVVSSTDPHFNLTIYNACSSQKTLGIMRNIAFMGLPFVLSYTVAIYWVFRGKVKIGQFSY